MSKELEETIREYRALKRNRNIIAKIEPDYFFEFADTILNHIENSIPKEKVVNKIKDLVIEEESEYFDNRKTIKILQELLEKK